MHSIYITVRYTISYTLPCQEEVPSTLLVLGGWTNILVHHPWCPHCLGVYSGQLLVSLAHQWPWHCPWILTELLLQSVDSTRCIAWMHCLTMQCLVLLFQLDVRRSHDLPCGCMLCSLIPHWALSGIFHSLFGEWFNYLWDTLRGEAHVDAEPLEDFYILICPFIPFRTCGWGSQLHTAIIAVWHFILTISQYIVISWDVKHFPELNFEGISHAF